MDKNRKLTKKYFNSESEALKVEAVITELENTSFKDGITSRWFEPVEVDAGGVWFVMIDELNPKHAEAAEALCIDYIELPFTDADKRRAIVEELITVATAFGLGSFIKDLFFDIRKTIREFETNGGNGLLEFFQNATEAEYPELFMSKDEGVTPREYALNLLQ